MACVMLARHTKHPDTALQVFKKIEKQLPQLTNLDLQFVSPELLRARDLQLAVPGQCALSAGRARADPSMKARTGAESRWSRSRASRPSYL
jgi:phosphatidylinositol kinase/protein kinase (PI-3  family)